MDSPVNINISLINVGFLAVLALMVLARAVTPRRWHVPLGAVASSALLGVASWPTLALLGGSTLLFVYPLARWIAVARTRSPAAARLALGFGSVAIIAAWVVFKLNREVPLPFLTGTVLSERLLRLIGFSYFIFKAINILYMHYLMGNVPHSTPIRALYFSVFPPTLTSGPIQKYADFCREAADPRPLDFANLCIGVERITRGYFYKLCLAVLLDGWSNRLLAIHEPNAYQSALTIACLYVFFFFDFAGYSNIAVGLGLLLGIRVPENFKQPFLATSVTEFWRNWHVTIGDWFRDHVFIPLGGMRLGGIRAALFAALIMLICGAWHGFTLVFLAWGGWHASMLFLEGVTGSKPMPPGERHGPWYWWRVLFTNMRIAFGAIFFLKSFDEIGVVLKGFLRWW